jgi:hypothetical protein
LNAEDTLPLNQQHTLTYADVAAAASLIFTQLSLMRVDCSKNYASQWGACLLGQHVGSVTITNSSFVGNLVS